MKLVKKMSIVFFAMIIAIQSVAIVSKASEANSDGYKTRTTEFGLMEGYVNVTPPEYFPNTLYYEINYGTSSANPANVLIADIGIVVTRTGNVMCQQGGNMKVVRYNATLGGSYWAAHSMEDFTKQYTAYCAHEVRSTNKAWGLYTKCTTDVYL